MLQPLFLVAALLGDPQSVPGVTITPGPMPTLAGITLSTPLSEVRHILGKPRSIQVVTDSSDDEFGISIRKRLTYSGVTLVVVNCDVGVPTASPADLCVLEIDITGSSRRLSNSLHVGMSSDKALRVMGPPLVTPYTDDSGVTTCTYYYGDGVEALILSFRNGVLREIEIWQGLQC